MMEENKVTFKSKISVIRMIHLTLAITLIAFAVVTLWSNSTNPTGELTEENQILLYIPGILLIVAFPISSILFKQQVNQGIKDGITLDKKIAVFQTSHLIRMALFQSAGLFAIVVCFLTANNYNLAVLAIVLIMFWFLLPSPSRIALDLKLSMQEREQLENS